MSEIELNDSEVEFLKKIHIATAIRDMMNHPGFKHYKKVSEDVLQRIKEQHINFAPKGTKDSYWASGLLLSGARQYADIMNSQIEQIVDLPNQELTTRRNEQMLAGDE